MFSFGTAGAPGKNDPNFDTYDLAEAAALQHQNELPWRWDEVLAIWKNESGECLALIHQGGVWRA